MLFPATLHNVWKFLDLRPQLKPNFQKLRSFRYTPTFLLRSNLPLANLESHAESRSRLSEPETG